ncbi:MAG: DUF4292 domain-containing protein [Muribaculaceae bacterium]|nr:DUF4292 domain-containing protein [Muribaculaceae bacterium]
MTMISSHNKISAIFLSALLLLSLNACKTAKDASRVYEHGVGASDNQPAQMHSLPDDYVKMTQSYVPWTDVTVPVKLTMSAPKSVSLSGTMTMVYGKAISMTFKMFIVEAASVYIDTDSVFFLSKPMGICYAESFERFSAASGLSLCDIQSLLLGQAFYPGAGTLSADDISLFDLLEVTEPANDGLFIFNMSPRINTTLAEWYFTAAAPRAEVEAMPQVFALNVKAGETTVECTFAQSEISPAGKIAAKMQLEGSVKKHKIDLVIASTYSKALWNSGATANKMKISTGTRILSTEQLLKLLNNRM